MILQRYIFRELVVTFAMAFAILIAVCSVGLILQMFRAYDVTPAFLAEMLPVAVAYMSHWALLVAATVTGTLTYGRLAAENEIDAMRASGIHMGRIVAPALLVAVGLVVLAFFVNHEIAPRGHYARHTLKSETVAFLILNPPRGDQSFKLGKYVRMGYSDADAGVFRNLHVYHFDDDERLRTVYMGRQGAIRFGSTEQRILVSMEGCHIRRYDYDRETGERFKRGDFPVPGTHEFELPVDDKEVKPKKPVDMHGLELVSEWARADEADERYRRSLYIQLHLRFARTLAPPLLFLMGVPIGIFVRRGTRLAGLGAALPPLLAYFPLYFFGESLAERGRLSTEVAAYGPDAIILLVTLLLLARVFRT